MNKIIKGIEYSVIGNTVYRQGSLGSWVTVDDPNEEATAGELREHNGTEYSRVGDKVYEKGPLGGWSLVTDDNQKANAGELRDVGGCEYSVVGNNVFKRGTLGGWESVESEGERASVGAIRKIGGCDYSLIGDSVYKKGSLGSWTEVENDSERALAGDKIEADGVEYAKVGDSIFRKGTLGGWARLDQDEKGRVVGYFAVSEAAGVSSESTGSSGTTGGSSLISPKTLGKIFAVVAVAFVIALLIPLFASGRKADVEKEVRQNLKQLNADAQLYFLEENPFPMQVKGGVLIDRYHSKIKSIDGEDYRDLDIIFNQPLSVRTKHGIVVNFEEGVASPIPKSMQTPVESSPRTIAAPPPTSKVPSVPAVSAADQRAAFDAIIREICPKSVTDLQIIHDSRPTKITGKIVGLGVASPGAIDAFKESIAREQRVGPLCERIRLISINRSSTTGDFTFEIGAWMR